jgi:hypothetical protein
MCHYRSAHRSWFLQEEFAISGEQLPPTDHPLKDTIDAMMHALVAATRKSRRAQTELRFALHQAGLTIAPDIEQAALDSMIAAGWLENLIALADGGTVVTVTPRGRRQFETAPPGQP